MTCAQYIKKGRREDDLRRGERRRSHRDRCRKVGMPCLSPPFPPPSPGRTGNSGGLPTSILMKAPSCRLWKPVSTLVVKCGEDVSSHRVKWELGTHFNTYLVRHVLFPPPSPLPSMSLIPLFYFLFAPYSSPLSTSPTPY